MARIPKNTNCMRATFCRRRLGFNLHRDPHQRWQRHHPLQASWPGQHRAQLAGAGEVKEVDVASSHRLLPPSPKSR